MILSTLWTLTISTNVNLNRSESHRNRTPRLIEESFIRKLISSIKCGSCGQHYEESRIDIIERNDELCFIKVVCSSCHVACMVAAIIREDKQSKLITDLTEAEIDKFKGISDIDEDDLLDMHDFLKDFNGDLSNIFRQ